MNILLGGSIYGQMRYEMESLQQRCFELCRTWVCQQSIMYKIGHGYFELCHTWVCQQSIMYKIGLGENEVS